ncbi:stage II sporulation protein Q [Thalassobacillus cyri]|uniref:Stage II sporulation protein Q n=1 Tax=Thalassobacillus cyri TaxID=571932 RepID=A0A1H4D8G2_9BACI|nr:M23 family metallopeptidase [Thalassobacillus cyri]SEA68760.1 stage II sporulation protein Q [Thalassobacillus cyri]
MRDEEKKSVTKLKFRRLLGKKWVYPAIYLSIAALVLAGVLWYQQRGEEVDFADDPNVNDEVITEDPFGDEDAVPVMESGEEMAMPVADEESSTIVTKFYDYDASDEDQENALVLYNNKYYQSTGVDITKNDEKFDVTAALSGTVTEVKEDPLYGNVVQLDHGQEVTTVYASLDEVQIEAGTEIKQGDVIGTAGRNIFGQASGVHVHFEVRKGGEALNPESFFGKPLSELEKQKEAEEPEQAEDNETSGEEEQNQDISEEEIGELEPGAEEEAPGEGDEETGVEEEPEMDEDAESSISMTQT